MLIFTDVIHSITPEGGIQFSFLKLSSTDVHGSYPFNEKFFLIFNVAVSSQWFGSPDASTTWPPAHVCGLCAHFQESLVSHE